MVNRIFSFNEVPSVHILNMLPSILPGIEKAISVYFSSEHQALKAAVLNNDADYPEAEALEVSDPSGSITKFRTDRSPYSWLQKSDLPFENLIKEKVQLDIFNEFENSILLVRIPNNFDNLNDLYFIYFSSGKGSFGPTGNAKLFSADNKNIIAHLVRNCILTSMENSTKDKTLFLTLTGHYEQTLLENHKLKNESVRIKEKLQDGIKDLCKHHLKKISSEIQRNLVLTQGAEEKILSFEGPPSDLFNIIYNASRIAELYSTEPGSEIHIREHHIVFEEKKQESSATSREETVPTGSSRYSKTILLLNKLENAATRIKARNEVLTSAGIGSELPVKISAPAISDALKKHRLKIIHLLNEFPDRWTIIRTEFRPVRNILSMKSGQEQLSA